MSKSLNPVSVYQKTRPTDWLSMPEPKDGEIYLLLHTKDGENATVRFAIVCDGEYFTDTKEDFGHKTEDGMLQAMLKITGQNIRKMSFSIEGFQNGTIVEICGRLPDCEYMSCEGLYSLKYFSLKGENRINDMTCMFSGCKNLTAVSELDTQDVENMYWMFSGCRSLVVIPELHTRNVKNMNGMFRLCSSLITIPDLDTRKAERMSFMFLDCESLVTIPQLDTRNVKDMAGMFYNCENLEAIPEMDTKRVKDMSCMFCGCHKLKKIPMLDTQNVVNMYAMFFNCFSLKEVPKLNTKSVKNMARPHI